MARQDAIALMYHVMRHRQRARNALQSKLARWRDSLPNPFEDGYARMIETRIYVGLNDAETKRQSYETEKYMTMLKDVCRSYHVAFSVDIEEGGYYHEDGEYTEETSLVLVMIDTHREKAKGIVKDLCALFHQEAILVTENEIVGRFVYGMLREE